MVQKREHRESVLAASVVAWLESEGWCVFQECRLEGLYNSVADIVCTRDQQVMVVECKSRYSLEVLSQAYAWRQTASFVSIAVPNPRHEQRNVKNVHETAREFCMWRGIGVIEVDPELGVRQRIAPRFTEIGYASPWLNVLSAEHQTHAKAGGNHGGYYTPFRGTREKIEAYVRDNPGVALRDLVKAVPHHYASAASARAQIEKLCRKGVFKGLELKRHGGHAYLYPKNNEGEAA